MNHVTSCGCFVVKNINGELHALLVKPTKSVDSWGVPKGHTEPGETHAQCARREVLEETGIAVADIHDTEEYTCHTKNRNVSKKVVLFIAFLAETDEQNPKPQEGEVDEVVWFKLTALPENIHRYQRNIVHKMAERAIELRQKSQ